MNELPQPEFVRQRLINQRLAANGLDAPADIVGWFGAIQAQDYFGANWAIAQRSNGLTDAEIDAAYNRGEILRTHVLRPTWHFVTPRDIRVLLSLTAPAIRASMAAPMRQEGLDAESINRYRQIIVRELRGQQACTREELFATFERAGVPASGQRGGYVLMLAEIDALVCSGPLKGKKHTYMLLDERVPTTVASSRDKALARLASLYFQSHGPGHERDLAWWSCLKLTDARRAIELAGNELQQTTVDGVVWHTGTSRPDGAVESPHVRLLPNFDEYFSRNGSLERYPGPSSPKLDAMRRTWFQGHHLMIDGLLRGIWRRSVTRSHVRLTVEPFAELSPYERDVTAVQAERLAAFQDLPLNLIWDA